MGNRYLYRVAANASDTKDSAFILNFNLNFFLKEWYKGNMKNKKNICLKKNIEN